MSHTPDPLLPKSRPARHGVWGYFHSAEEIALSLVLGAMALLPLAEILLRGTLRIGIANAAALKDKDVDGLDFIICKKGNVRAKERVQIVKIVKE